LIEITFGHGGRHLLEAATTEEAEAAIARAIGQQAATGAKYSGEFWGRVQLASGKVLQYRAYGRTNGSINVGTYWPIP
jgi:hypothetical protein